MNGLLEIIAIVIPIVALLFIVFVGAMVFSPKMRTAFTKREIKAAKSMFEDLQGELTEMGTAVGSMSANIQKGILDKNEETMKENARRTASIEKESIEIKARALKDGLTKNSKYCKHCGTAIDEDSKFCKECGKEQ